MQQVYAPNGSQRVFVCDASPLSWQGAGKEGIALKPVRYDAQRGHFLGLVGFEPFARSGVHQHQGVASSYFVDGALTDHQGSASAGEVGVNLKGATHEAIAYRKTLLVSRLEAPVLYLPQQDLPQQEELALTHAGARRQAFETPDVDAPPDLNIRVDALRSVPVGIEGVARRMIFDYAGCDDDRRLLELSLRARSALPRWRAAHRVELWVHGGDISVNGRQAWANCFVIIEPDTEVAIESRFGARLLVWADGPATMLSADAAGRPLKDLFGFERHIKGASE